MTQRTVNGFYNTYAEAVQVMADLTAAGLPADRITMIESEADARLPSDVARDQAQNPAGTGATLGTAIGGGFGALLGVGAISLPASPLDRIIATGWVLPCLIFAGIGAAIGAVIGAVTRVGVTNRQAHNVAERLHRGQHLVMVQVDESIAPQIQEIMNRPHTLPPGTQVPEPAFDEEYRPPVPGGDREAVAAIHRRESTIDYKSE